MNETNRVLLLSKIANAFQRLGPAISEEGEDSVRGRYILHLIEFDRNRGSSVLEILTIHSLQSVFVEDRSILGAQAGKGLRIIRPARMNHLPMSFCLERVENGRGVDLRQRGRGSEANQYNRKAKRFEPYLILDPAVSGAKTFLWP